MRRKKSRNLLLSVLMKGDVRYTPEAVVDKSKTLGFFGLLGVVPVPDERDIPDPLEDEDEEGVAFVTFEELVGMRLAEAVEAANAPDD